MAIARALLLCALVSCVRDRSRVDSVGAAPPDSTQAPIRLDSAARDIVGFLQGAIPFDSIAFADSVVLQVSPEGGAGRTVMPRESLRDRARWVVNSSGGTYAFVPHPTLTKLTTRVGRHLKCMEYELSSLAPNLSTRPHVGTKLEPPDGDSCLQTWNVTFVFDTSARTPQLVAALYDQWEW
jgi:hypothetical protein